MTIGLVVNERESADAPVVAAADLGISAWAIYSRRGIPGKAVRVFNFTEAKKLFFAEADPDFMTYYMLKGLWDNAGPQGAEAWVKRVAGAGAVAASANASANSAAGPGAMTSSNGAFPADLFDSSGSTAFTGAVSAGTPATATFTYTRAMLTGAAATYAAVGSGDALRLLVNGLPVNIIFAGSENSQLLYLAALNSQLEGAGAINSGGQVRLQTDKFGSGATIQVLGTSTAGVLTALGLTATTGSGSGNVANARAVTFAEFKSVFDAAFTGSTVDAAGTNGAKWRSTATGASTSVQLTAGNGITPTPKVTGWDTTLHSGTASASGNVWLISAGQYGYADPGTWANGKLYFEVLPSTSGVSTQVDLAVYYKSDLDTAAVLKERFRDLTNENVVSTVNHPSKGSAWVTLSLVGSPTSVPGTAAGPILLSSTTAGTEGSTPAESSYSSSLAAFNGQNVQLVLAPDLQTLLQAQNLEVYSSARGDTLSLFTAPHGATDGDLETNFNGLLQIKSFLAGYRGWLTVDDERGGTLDIPALGHLIGAGFIRKVKERGNFPHIAPAGPVANVKGAISVDDGVYDQARLTRVNKAGFNPVVFQSGLGVFAKTSRTFSTTNKWYSIHVRIQANYLKVSFLNTFSELEQETNNPDTRRRLRNPIIDFLETQFQNGGIETTGGFVNNVLVACDEGNNTETVVQARRMVCDVSYRPSEIAESIEINLIRTTEGLAATDA